MVGAEQTGDAVRPRQEGHKMYLTEESIRGIQILGVFETKEKMSKQLDALLFYPGNRYVLIEVGSGRENLSLLLDKLGVPGTRAGAQYLYDAILLGMEKGFVYITKSLYPEVAAMHHTSREAVETSIRVVIRESWERADPAVRRMVFGKLGTPGCRRPANRIYIRMVINYLMEEKEEANVKSDER